MADIVIRRRVSLAFLGDGYEDSFIMLKAIGVDEYEKIMPKIQEASSNLETIKYMCEVLKDKFVSGQIAQDGKTVELTKENIGQFDEYTLAECFAYITGQKLDPKE